MYKQILIYVIFIAILIVAFSGCVEIKNNPDNNPPLLNNVFINGKGNYSTIQKAIDNASNNDTIFVHSGTYYENIDINKSIELIGNGRDNTIIDGNKSGDVIHVSANRTKISGFTIQNGGDGLYDAGIYIHSNNVEINNNLIINSYHGIYLDRETQKNNVSNNVILNNLNGIYLVSSYYNNISFNDINNNTYYGLYARDHSDYNMLWKNTFSYNNDGMRIKTSKYNKVFENNIVNNYDKGIYVCCSSSNNLYYKNSILENEINAQDSYSNQWNFNYVGNYWGDYTEKYPDAKDADGDGIWDIPYQISGGSNIDEFPLTEPYS